MAGHRRLVGHKSASRPQEAQRAAAVCRRKTLIVRYRKDAHRTLEVARHEARALNHNYIGTEHLLLALTVGDFGIASQVLAELGVTEARLKRQVGHEPDTISDYLTDTDARALASIGIDLDEVRHAVEQTFGPSVLHNPPPCPTGTPFTDKALKAMHATPGHARRLRHWSVGPEHLLIALMDDGGTLAVRLIERLGITPDSVRERVLQTIHSD